MNEEALSETLHDAYADVDIGPPPLARMHTDAGRIRRNRFAALTSAAAVVAVVAGLGTWSALSGGDSATDPPPAAPAAGLQSVGIGGVVVAVPDSWVRVTEATSPYCGSDSEGVVAYHAPDCEQAHQDAVHLLAAKPADLLGWEETEVSGEQAYRTPISTRHRKAGDGEPTVWTSQLFLPGEQVIVSVISSRSSVVVRDLLDSVALSDRG